MNKGHFHKNLICNSRKKDPTGKILQNLFLDTLKAFQTINVSHNEYSKGFLFQNQGTFFQFSKKDKEFTFIAYKLQEFLVGTFAPSWYIFILVSQLWCNKFRNDSSNHVSKYQIGPNQYVLLRTWKHPTFFM